MGGKLGSRAKRAIAALAVALVGATALSGVPADAALDPCAGNWAPVLREFVATQGVGGLGGYSPLARDKTTTVRLQLTAPACAPADSVILTSATLRGTDPLTNVSVVPNGSVPTTPGVLGDNPANYPKLDPYTAPTPNGPANPLFVVKHLAAAPGVSAGQFPASFAADITYQFQATAGGAWTTRTASFPGTSGVAMSATVAPKSNPLRVLIAPMGDNSLKDAMKLQFPKQGNSGTPINGQYADTVTQIGMQTLARVLPTADGPTGVGDVGDLTSTAAGLRYRIDDANLIDLGPAGLNVMENGAYCAYKNGVNNFSVNPNVGKQSVTDKLLAYLQDWNSKNPGAQADRIMGVMWQTASKGAEGGCAEGVAVMNGRVAYSRLLPDKLVQDPAYPTDPTRKISAPSITGSIMGMEIAHTWGSVATDDARRDGTHSKYVSADPNNVRRTYNTTLGQWLSAPLSQMNYTGRSEPTVASPWNNNTTVFESADYLYSLCRLTPGMSPVQCPPSATPGSVGSAQAGPSVVVTGTTDGTSAGTRVHSFFAEVEQTPDTPSGYTIVQYNALGVPLSTRGVPISFETSEHHDAEHDHSSTGVTGSFYAAVQLVDGVGAFELRSPAGSLLYRRVAGPAPQLTASPAPTRIVNLQDFTNVTGDETQPALSPSGRHLAWLTSAGIVVQGRDLATNLPTGSKSAAFPGSAPAWSPDGKKLAYVTSAGDIEVRTVDTTKNPPQMGGAVRLYHVIAQGVPALLAAASHPTWSPKGTELAAAINGGIWKMDATGGENTVHCNLGNFVATLSCAAIATDGTDAAPSWGAVGGTGGNGLVAYTNGTDIFTVDPTQPRTGVRRIANASAPAWGSNVLAHVQNGSIWIANSSILGPTGLYTSRTQLTSGQIDTWPAVSADAKGIAFDRLIGAPSTNGHDVMNGTLEQSSTTLDFSATDDNPGELRADLYLGRANSYDPIYAAEHPTSVSGSTASWSLRYEDVNGCPGCTIYVQVTDGFQSTPLTPIRTIPVNPPEGTQPGAPSPAIGAPTPGSTYLQYDAVIAVGSNVDPSVGTNGSGVQMEWTLTGPSGSGYDGTSVLGTTNRLELNPRFPGGWAPGAYTLTLTVTNSAGLKGTASTTFRVLPDPQHRGSNVRVQFNPQTLYVPSSGTNVTIRVIPQGQDLSKVLASSVHISRVGNTEVSIPTVTGGGTKGWASNGDGTYTAKFDRQVLTCAMFRTGLVAGYIPVTVTGETSTKIANPFVFEGYDPIHPNTNPADSPATCP